LIGITYPKKELENIDISRGKNENIYSINKADMCGLQVSGTVYRLVVGLSNKVITTQVTCNVEKFFSDVTAVLSNTYCGPWSNILNSRMTVVLSALVSLFLFQKHGLIYI
jgi:hypothetical protein